jgi:predicted metal-binding membrane protein
MIAVTGLAALTILTWAYNVQLASNRGAMPVSMPGMQGWTAGSLLILWLMWAVMMVSMMAPSMVPSILTFLAIARQRRGSSHLLARGGVFLAGYIGVWAVSCVLLTLAQWGLHSAELLSPTMMATSTRFSGGLLVLAGVFQWSALKYKCLARCRSPLGFLMNEWREGPMGPVIMGFRYGAYCVGCCWLLMTILFVVGVMNLVWVAILSAFVLTERTLPFGRQVAAAGGAALVVWGTWLLF